MKKIYTQSAVKIKKKTLFKGRTNLISMGLFVCLYQANQVGQFIFSISLYLFSFVQISRSWMIQKNMSNRVEIMTPNRLLTSRKSFDYHKNIASMKSFFDFFKGPTMTLQPSGQSSSTGQSGLPTQDM